MSTSEWKTPSWTEISGLFKHASREVDTFSHLTEDKSRKRALAIAQGVVAALEKPEDVVMRYAWEVSRTALS